MLKDIGTNASVVRCLIGMAVTSLIRSLLPALSLWFTGQLLTIAQLAVDERRVDRDHLFKIAAGRLACSLALQVFNLLEAQIRPILGNCIRRHYSVYMFRETARLDVPTFNDSVVQDRLQKAASGGRRSSVAWDAIYSIFGGFVSITSLVTRTFVLVRVVRGQPDGPLLALVACIPHFIQVWPIRDSLFPGGAAWIMTTFNSDYIKMEGIKQVVQSSLYRKEVVAGGMWQHLLAEYTNRLMKLGDHALDTPSDILDRSAAFVQRLSGFLIEPLHELPQIIFTLRTAERPATIPTSIASLNLISSTAAQFTSDFRGLTYTVRSVSKDLSNIRQLYEVENIRNQVEDGALPYPEDQAKIRYGISVEFKNVSFRYPDAADFALKGVSFSIGQGQLCVIVGRNGSGKSTILKLIARIYDPLEGTILIDGKDIKTLKLDDLRRATAVLFQDYTHFPLSIGDNIGLGDPEHWNDMARIEEAARLGGADEVVARLPDGFDTYLDSSAHDTYCYMPAETLSRLRKAGGLKSTESSNLSGGQIQRIALSRTFMRSLSPEKPVGLLLFDEPSASLDPVAEHDLFERLRHLRGDKTMIFSSHRFGNLTRHADLILYMDNSVVVEEGTHAELVASGGEYAKIWNIQAQAFI
ncbi:P-loop containing nucleoside triphosphate hydrolase protein [Cylindrobasidium torrendii FP15055 ss-10]|uniref:p-loop containing nucleoside triphosphate hydrolase protein n=1 Tax=Cylindrobasidium torrendii FP15055 ss-10 TaxID=1314674 RepID=A0A0D7B4G0_9AGAR|nr:P-loop containing nucleoside triphosphate hydrolase protein [Cylindrobasidium torrendii FP15055 ss-10]